MSGLCVNKQFVQGWDLDVSNQAEIDSHPDLAQVMHGLFAAYLLCRAQNAQRSTDVVMQVLFAFLNEKLAGAAFVFDQPRNDFLYFAHQCNFVPAQSRLIAHLVKVSHELGAFTKEATHRHIDLVQRTKNFVYLLSSHQGGQMKHDADSKPRSNIGRACSEVT